jgi:hypothetical protein
VFDELDDPNPPEPDLAARDAVRARVRHLQRRRQGGTLAVAALVALVAGGLVWTNRTGGTTVTASVHVGVSTSVPATRANTAPVPTSTESAGTSAPSLAKSHKASGPMSTASATTAPTISRDAPMCTQSDLSFAITTDQTTYTPGHAVHVTVTYRNVSGRTCWPNPCGELSIADGGGRVIWKPQVVCPAVRYFLRDGESQSYPSDWDQTCNQSQPSTTTSADACSNGRAGPGSYTAIQDWESYGRNISPPFRLT